MQMAVAQPEFLNFRWGDLPLIGVALKMFSKSMQIAAIPGLKYHHGSHHAVIDTTGSPLVIEPPGPEAPEGLNHSYLELVENARRMALQGKLAEAERVLLDLAGDRPGIDFLTIALCHIGLQLGRNGLVERLFQTIDKRLTSTDAMVALGKSMAIARGQVQIGDVLVGRHDTVDRFYEAYFGSSENKCVIQVGANDGVMCDPLRRFFADIERNDLNAVLIEPIPFYYRKLGQLYTGYEHIALYNAACGARRDTLSLYFIDPDVADEMNGDGPANDWAHGQGSFDRDVVLYWIDRNRFRGPGYVQNIEKYQHSITQIDVDMIRLADLDLAKSNENLLIVIDAQGFELQVISGVDWNFPPAFIVFEDDIGGGDSEIAALLKEKGYFHLCGENDKVFFRR
jgi:FkbM family methyltransferase